VQEVHRSIRQLVQSLVSRRSTRTCRTTKCFQTASRNVFLPWLVGRGLGLSKVLSFHCSTFCCHPDKVAWPAFLSLQFLLCIGSRTIPFLMPLAPGHGLLHVARSSAASCCHVSFCHRLPVPPPACFAWQLRLATSPPPNHGMGIVRGCWLHEWLCRSTWLFLQLFGVAPAIAAHQPHQLCGTRQPTWPERPPTCCRAGLCD
jgi:hypothetical protein